MKYLITLIVTVMSLHGGMFDFNIGGDDEKQEVRKEQKEIHDRFRLNVRDANAIVKRGDYGKINRYETEIQHLMQRIDTMSLPAPEKEALSSDMKAYAALVNMISDKLQERSPELNDRYNEVLGGLRNFNKKLSSIGLVELLNEWKELSRIKNRFVKQPSNKLAKQFEQTWMSVTVIITELYLDEEMEDPLFDYLNRYKAYFAELNEAYRVVGYSKVAELKPLSYKIKMQLELTVPHT